MPKSCPPGADECGRTATGVIVRDGASQRKADKGSDRRGAEVEFMADLRCCLEHVSAVRCHPSSTPALTAGSSAEPSALTLHRAGREARDQVALHHQEEGQRWKRED